MEIRVEDCLREEVGEGMVWKWRKSLYGAVETTLLSFPRTRGRGGNQAATFERS